MKIKSKQLARALFDALKDNPGNENKILDNFLKFLQKNNLQSLGSSVLVEFERLVEKEKESGSLRVSSSHELSKKTLNKVAEFVGADKKTSQVVVSKNPDLLAGFVAFYKGKIYDASAKRVLEKMAADLKRVSVTD